MRRKPDPRETEFRDAQVCAYRCGMCDFAFTGTLADWRTIRETHRTEAHPGWKPTKRRLIGSGSNARVKVLTEREMAQGISV